MRQHATELHHHRRSYGKDLVYVLLLDKAFDADGDDTFFSVRAVVGHYDCLIAAFAYLVLKYYQLPVSPRDNRQHTVAGGFQSPDDWQHGRHAHTSASTNHRPEVFYVSRIAQRSHNVGNEITFIQPAQLYR